MHADPSPRQAATQAAILRREQFTAIASRSIATAVCSLGSFVGLAATFWRGNPHGFLLGVFAALLLLHGAAVERSRAWLAGPKQDLSDIQFTVRVLISALVASAWSSTVVLMPSATADQRQLIVYALSGFTASSMLVAPILSAAIAVAVIPSLALLLVMPFLHQNISLQHALFVVLFSGMILVAVRHQNRTFSRCIRSEAAAREARNTIALLLRDFEQDASDLMWEVDADFVLRDPSPRLCAFLHRSPGELEPFDLRTLLDQDPSRHTDGLDRFRAAIERREPFRDLRLPVAIGGQQYWFSFSGRPALDADDAFAGYRGVASDVTDAQRSTDRIAYLARYDSLTGLPNRILFHEALGAAAGSDTPFVLLCLDLDGFKPINDTYGHGVGDELLTVAAARLRGTVRAGDTVARLGGDEFAVLLPGVDEREAVALAERMIDVTGRPFAIRDLRVSVTLSVGIVAATAGMTTEQLLQAGDIALYESKNHRRGSWSLFEQAMADSAQERHLLQVDLRDAIENGGLDLAFQPILDTRDRRIACVEALARWHHPRLGSVTPDRFIPLAENNGLIIPLGAWVLRRACREAATWPDDVRVAVNLSPLQLRQDALLSTIDAALSDAGLPAERLEIEITESVFLEDAEITLGRLRALRERGIRISLDDFGTGYSSLSYLRSFPFDKVKIDRSFVRDLSRSEQALAIVQAIIGMASSLGIATTGEGVETTQQAAMLDSAGCEEVQGFLFGRPCSGREINRLVGARPVPPPAPVGLLDAETVLA